MPNKSTPGPWLQCGHQRPNGPCTCGYIFSSDGQAYIAKALGLDDDVDHVCTNSERLANARLIAAAPDLLEALKLLWAEVEASGNSYAKDYGWPKAAEVTKAALKKAEGVQ